LSTLCFAALAAAAALVAVALAFTAARHSPRRPAFINFIFSPADKSSLAIKESRLTVSTLDEIGVAFDELEFVIGQKPGRVTFCKP